MSRGFLLHSRPYRETSMIATFMTDTDGRVDLMVRSAQRGRNRKSLPPLPFCLYELSWSGKGDLRHLQFFEPADAPVQLSGSGLYCGFYLNELLYRLLPFHVPEHFLLQSYAVALKQLTESADIEPVLRQFELTLLECLGYGLDFSCDESGQALQAGNNYSFVPEKGLTRFLGDLPPNLISGVAEEFQAIMQRDFSTVSVRHLAKSVLRASLAVYLGGRPLRSRELFSR